MLNTKKPNAQIALMVFADTQSQNSKKTKSDAMRLRRELSRMLVELSYFLQHTDRQKELKE